MLALKGKHIAKAADFSLEALNDLVSLAQKLKEIDESGTPLPPVLQGKVMAPLFFENSSRTFCSFVSAMQKLGGGVVELNLDRSSISKGETLDDTVHTVAASSDVVVIRHPDASVFESVSAFCEQPLLNAGNGTGEHPTQALLDIVTIASELSASEKVTGAITPTSHINGLVIALVGDLKNGRTVHSLAKTLTMFTRITFLLVAPAGLEMPEAIVSEITNKGFKVLQFPTLTPEVVRDANVVYMTRVQKERFQSLEQYDGVKGTYNLTTDLMKVAKPVGEMIVMHPLPRNEELPTQIDSDPRARYFQQMRYGMYARMALLVAVLGRTENLK